MFSIGKNRIFNLESAHKADFLVLGKALNININYIDYFMFNPSTKHVKWKHIQVQVYIQQ